MTAIQIASLDHLVLTVRDIEATIEFYVSVLGMTVETFGHGRKAIRFGPQKINLHQLGKEVLPNARRAACGSADLCFLTETPIEDVISHLNSLGVQLEPGIEYPARRTGAKRPLLSVYIRDPDENLIEIANEV